MSLEWQVTAVVTGIPALTDAQYEAIGASLPGVLYHEQQELRLVWRVRGAYLPDAQAQAHFSLAFLPHDVRAGLVEMTIRHPERAAAAVPETL